MPDTTPRPEPTILAQDLGKLKDRLNAIPDGKTGAVVISAVWKAGVPVSARFGVATRIGDHWTLGAEVEERFKKHPPEASIYVGLTW